MLKTINVSKRFDSVFALENLSTEIQPGTIYGLVGPNGSGKSTLMRLLSGIYKADSGRVLLDGDSVFENEKIKERIFYLSDDLYFPPKASMNDLMLFYRNLYSNFSMVTYERLCSCFPINPNGKLNTFSKGMRRQAALIVAISCQADYLLLDEAFDGLDPVIRLLVKKVIAEQIESRNISVVISSHNLRELEDLCDQIGLLSNGRILFEKNIDALKLGFCKVQAAFDHPVDWDSLNLDILEKKSTGMLVRLLVRGQPDDILSTILQENPKFAETIPMTLEEVFIGEMEAVGYDYNNILS